MRRLDVKEIDMVIDGKAQDHGKPHDPDQTASRIPLNHVAG